MAYAITNYSFPGVAGAKPRITAVLDSAADVEALGGTEKWSPGSLAILAEAGFPTLLLSKSNGWVNGNTGGSGGGSSLPSGSSPNQYLVTDSEGNAKWEDKLAWSEEGKVTLVELFTEEYGTETPNRNRFPLTLEEGKNYTVKWDGVEYDCTCFADELNCLVVGNASLMEAGANTNEPFLVGVQDGDSFVKAQTGGDHELTIFGIVETVHTINPKYLPTLCIALDLKVGRVTSNTPAADAIKLLSQTDFVSVMVINKSNSKTNYLTLVSIEYLEGEDNRYRLTMRNGDGSKINLDISNEWGYTIVPT